MTQLKIENVKVNDIIVNKQNARHGSLDNEQEAINWILNDNPNRLMSLAKDIANTGILYERPLLRKEDNHYVVYDGNRRITCMKLLNNPNYIEDESWVKFFTDLKNSNANIPNIINCDVSSDITFINNLVERRHVGGDTGSGQVKWNRTQKDNYLLLTGRKVIPSFTVYFQEELRKKGMISGQETFKHSVFKRFLSNEDIRNTIGFSILKDGSVEFIKDYDEVLSVIFKIYNDFESDIENLNTLWDNEGKYRYLNSLKEQGFIPTIPYKKTSKTSDDKSKDKSKLTVNSVQSKVMSFLDTDFPIEVKTNEEIKLQGIWNEMKYRLSLSKNPYSLGVMTRVLLELSTDYCIDKNKIKGCSKNSSLNAKMLIVVDYMYSKKLFTNTEANNLKGTANVDINNLHAFVHHLGAHPTKKDLISLWGKFKDYIVFSLTE